MRNQLPSLLALAALAACSTTPAFHESAVRVAPAYGLATAVSPAAVPAPAAAPAAGERPADAALPAAAPVQYRMSDAAVPFWRELGDPTLALLVTDALGASPSVRSAEARLSGARAARRLAAFGYAPTITGNASALRSQQSVAQIPGLADQLPGRDLYDFGFDASWELDVFGRTRRTVGAEAALASSSRYALADVQVTLAAEVARAYFELRGAERQLAVARRNAENQRRTVSLTEDRLAAGRGTAFDTERAHSVLALTLAGVPAIELQIGARRYALAALLGRTTETLPPAVYAAADLPALPDTLDVGSPRELVRRRPDVLRAERVAAAGTSLVGAAKAGYLPTLSLGASAGYTSTRLRSLAQAGTSRVLFGPVLSFPLLDVGRVRERVTIARSQADEARSDYDATVLRAVEEAETSLAGYDRAHARVAILADAVRSSTRASALAEQRFAAGLTDFFQVLDAQRTLLESENALAVAHTSAATALVAVYKSVGGTWPRRQAP